MRKNFKVTVAILAAMSMMAGCGQTAEVVETVETESEVVESTEETVEESSEEAEEATESADEDAAAEYKGELLMATTTSTADTGLLDYLVPIFLEDTGWELFYDSVGTGEAISLGENGDVDVILVHAKASEEAFVADGYGVERFPVMFNDFVVVGPTTYFDYTGDITEAFTAVVDQELNFISRGDDSGTDKKEKAVWKAIEIDPTQNPNYVESGQGMGATITMADEQLAYCLTDRGTWLKMSTDAEAAMEIDVVCEGDTNLLNQYGVIAVSPEMYPDINNEGANDFIEWICSEEIQALIAEFGVDKYGQALFTPNAGTDN